ncbi:glucans biosynthesis glucosyltransferase MdoH [Candidatus Binatia bacterium]|nr:glucans biosynthesis glucosyltransferase MdoH [Candidatus Binatia bacterium]
MSSALTPPSAANGRLFRVGSDRLVQDWKEAHDRAVAYLDALAVPAADRDALADTAVEQALDRERWEPDSDAISETMRALRKLVPDRYPRPGPEDAAVPDPFLAWRLEVAATGSVDAHVPATGTSLCAAGPVPFASTPPLARGAMVPEHIERRIGRRVLNRLRGRRSDSHDAPRGHALRVQRRALPWIGAARRRRLLFLFLVLIPSVVASGFMVNVLPHQGSTWLEVVIVHVFGALFGWISIGFWTALLGFFLLTVRRDRYAITRLDAADAGPFAPSGRTAIVMPICEEPVDRVFAGLKAIHRSLERAGGLPHFDFFVLSDSYSPDTYVKEEEAWARWGREVGGFGHIFYRRRKVRLKRKSGNVADFCRRWGRKYPYMIMLDADSVMSGETLVRLVRLMDKHPQAGMIQTAPTAVNRNSLFARIQQFATRVYGPMFAAGLHYWQLGDGQYWGHNTIIRIQPFMQHCALPRLPGKPPLGGEILSHDFVEAALMGRAGWTLWLAYDLDGSYEEVPSTLLEEMKRDRRWCQGNLQHLRLLFTEGLFGAHRALFINGVLSYVSALLWFFFLTLSTVEAVQNALAEHEYFPHGASLFPTWPVWRPNWALALLAVTGAILFLPKFLSIVLVVARNGNARSYGGLARLTLSVLCEIVISSLLAPIRMVFHSRFVVQNLMGRTVTWKSQGREDAETGWGEAIRHHGFDTLFASAWGTTLYLLNPGYFWWVTPIIGALILSVPVSVLASRIGLGERARAWKLFLIPEESDRPRELRELDGEYEAAQRRAATRPPAENDGVVRVAVDPYTHALHRGLLGRRRSLRASIRATRATLLRHALSAGAAALAPRERRVLLGDPDLVDDLHDKVWAESDHERVRRWGRPGRV